MTDFISYGLHQAYERVKRLGDKLDDLNKMIKWERFRPIVKGMFNNQGPQGGRPNLDEVMMIKILFLGEWNGLSDPELERQIADKISFQRFLGFPKKIPDHSTIWAFRERLKDTGKYKEIWDELQRQLDEKGLKIKKGMIQDATFITADPGHAKADKPRGDEAKTRRNKDGTWAKKGNKSYFGYKLHTIIDTKFNLIRDLETTPANIHDSQVDLAKENFVIYKDKGYFGVPSKGFDATMKRATPGRKLTIRDKLRNKRISKKRAPGERPFAVIKNIFKAGHVLVTTLARVNIKMIFAAIAFNLYQLLTLKKKGVLKTD